MGQGWGILLLTQVFMRLGIQVDASSASACLESGEAAGQLLLDRGLSTSVAARRAYLLVNKGTINCYGLVTEWSFYQLSTTTCDEVSLHIWRLTSGTTYRMVGRSTYVPADQACVPTAVGVQTLRISADRQIPVEPGDIIGLSMDTYNGMVSHATGANTSVLVSNNFRNHNPGNNRNFNQGTLDVDFSIQALINRANPALFSTLPRGEQFIAPGSSVSSSIYQVTAVHPGNVLPQRNPRAVMDNAVVLTYGLLPQVTDFTIDSSTGNIITVTNLEYEAGRVYELPVTVTALALTSTATLTVTVRDVPPVLTVTAPPSPINVSALDKLKDDEIYPMEVETYTGNRTLQFYLAEPQSSTPPGEQPPPFYIQQDTGVIRCDMDLSEQLHNEASPPLQVDYTFDVIITDTVLYVRHTLTVTVLQLRQPPVIRNLPESIAIPEDIQGLEPIFKVEVETTYPDPLTFWIHSIDPPTSLDYFTINSTSGEIWVTEDHKLQRGTSYNLTLGVKDTKLEADLNDLEVNVTTVNTAPYFDPQEYFVTIPEKCDEVVSGTCPGSWTVPDLILSVRDRESGGFSCNAVPWQGFAYNYFRLTGSCAGQRLRVISTIDVDADPSLQSINLTTSVSDTGFAPTLRAVGYIYITVYDINDKTPQFTDSNYTMSVDENTPGGVVLTTITATDADLTSPNNKVTYFIQNKNGSDLGNLYFQIDAETGVLSTKQPVDYETYTYIEFEVVAQDGGSPQKYNTTDVLVIINDLNDLHPEFQCVGRDEDDPYPPEQECFYNLELRSDTNIGHEVLQMLSTDNDTVTPDTYFFLLKPDAHFLLQNHDGLVLTKQELDEYSKYILYCFSEDRGTPNLLTQVQYVRVDTYPPEWHLVDMTLELPLTDFNRTSVQLGFLTALRDLLAPWHVKIEAFASAEDKTRVTIYALADNTTYMIDSLRQEKVFVHRNDLLGCLRKNIHGTPSDDLQGSEFDDYPPIQVMPTYVIWWTDTVEGIATICVLCFLFVVLCITIATLVCKRYGVLCFERKPPVDHAWQDSKPASMNKAVPQMKLNYAISDTGSVRQRAASARAEPVERRDSLASVETVHTLIYDRQKLVPSK